MMLFDFFPEIAFKVKMMYGIMRYIIKQVTQNKAGEESEDIIGRQNGIKKKIKTSCQGNTYRGRQYQTFCITRIIMVNAVKNKVEPLCPWLIRRGIVEHKTVHDIFNKCPNKKAEYKQAKTSNRLEGLQ